MTRMIFAMGRGLRLIGRALGVAGRATVALVGVCGVVAALANYTMTQGSGTNFGSIVVSTVHYVQMLVCDPTTPANCGSVKAGNAAATTDIAQVVSDPNAVAAINGPTSAGENHIGEIASNQIKVQVAQTVTAASAYASGNAIGGLMTIAGATRVSGASGAAGTGGILTGMMMNAKSLQTTQVDVVFFDANPSGSTCTDKTAFSLATADFDKVVGYLTVPGTAANGAGWVAGTVGSVGVATYYPVTYDLASSTSLFACAVTRGTPTYTATTDVSFKFNILRN